MCKAKTNIYRIFIFYFFTLYPSPLRKSFMFILYSMRSFSKVLVKKATCHAIDLVFNQIDEWYFFVNVRYIVRGLSSFLKHCAPKRKWLYTLGCKVHFYLDLFCKFIIESMWSTYLLYLQSIVLWAGSSFEKQLSYYIFLMFFCWN